MLLALLLRIADAIQAKYSDITIYQLIGIEDPYKLTDEELLVLNELRKDNNKEIVKRGLKNLK